MVYVDTSVWVALLCPEIHSESVASWFGSESRPLVSADWTSVEFESALALMKRTGRLPVDREKEVREAFGRIDQGLRPWVPVTRASLRLASELVSRWEVGLRSGDAVHVAVAQELGVLDFATVDRAQTRAAAAQGMRLVFPDVAGDHG